MSNPDGKKEDMGATMPRPSLEASIFRVPVAQSPFALLDKLPADQATVARQPLPKELNPDLSLDDVLQRAETLILRPNVTKAGTSTAVSSVTKQGATPDLDVVPLDFVANQAPFLESAKTMLRLIGTATEVLENVSPNEKTDKELAQLRSDASRLLVIGYETVNAAPAMQARFVHSMKLSPGVAKDGVDDFCKTDFVKDSMKAMAKSLSNTADAAFVLGTKMFGSDERVHVVRADNALKKASQFATSLSKGEIPIVKERKHG